MKRNVLRRVVKWTLGRYVSTALDHALDAKAAARQMLTDTTATPAQRDRLMDLERYLCWLCNTLDQAAQQTLVGSGPETPITLSGPFAAA